MGREGIQNILLVEGNSSNLQTNLTDQDSRRDLRQSYLNGNLEENASGETAVPYEKAKDENLRLHLGFRLSGLDLYSIFTGFVVFEAISCLCYLLTRDFSMYLFLFSQFTTFIGIFIKSKASMDSAITSIGRHSAAVGLCILLSAQFVFLYSGFSWEPKNKESIITALVFRLVCYTIIVVSLDLEMDFLISPIKISSLDGLASCVIWSLDDLAFRGKWSLWRVVKGCHGFCLSGLRLRSFFIGFVVFEAISCLCYLLIGDGLWDLLTGDLGMYLFLFAQFMTFIGIIFTIRSINLHSDPVVMWTLLSVQFVVLYSRFCLETKIKKLIIIASVFRLVCYTTLVVLLSLKEEPPSEPDDLRVQIEEDHHESFQSDFRRSPDDLASCVSGTDRQTLGHDQRQNNQGDDEDKDGKLPCNKRSLVLYPHRKYKKSALVVLFLILEAISFVLDFIGKGKFRFTVAAFLLALFVFIPTLWVYLKGRSTRLPDERPIANVELLVSGIQLLTTILHLIFLQKGVYDKYNLSLLPLALAVFRAFSVVFAFRKEHENGIHNAAEPPAENPVNQLHDGLRNIMVHMTVTGMRLNMVIDLTMVTSYEQLFRKLRDEMFQAEKVLWGDRPRWNVLYVDISDEAHYLREDEISWGEFCMAARKICISRKEVRKELYRRWESMPRTSEKGLERALFT